MSSANRLSVSEERVNVYSNTFEPRDNLAMLLFVQLVRIMAKNFRSNFRKDGKNCRWCCDLINPRGEFRSLSKITKNLYSHRNLMQWNDKFAMEIRASWWQWQRIAMKHTTSNYYVQYRQKYHKTNEFISNWIARVKFQRSERVEQRFLINFYGKWFYVDLRCHI